MASSLSTCNLIKDFLASMDADAPRGAQGQRMMEDKLRLYLWWKGKLSERKAEGKAPIALPKGRDDDTPISEALKKKDKERMERAANRRRVRGGAPKPVATGRDVGAGRSTAGDVGIKQEAEDIAVLCVLLSFRAHCAALSSRGHCSLSSQGVVDPVDAALSQSIELFTMDDDFDTHYGLLAPAQTVLVRPYSDDSDDQVLHEVKPRFIVMYEPNLEFIRRIEVRRHVMHDHSVPDQTCTA